MSRDTRERTMMRVHLCISAPALILAMVMAAPAYAQTQAEPPAQGEPPLTIDNVAPQDIPAGAEPDFQDRPAKAEAETVPMPAAPVSKSEINFQADRIDYDSNADIVRASGNVRVARHDANLSADQVEWDRKAGTVIARGDVLLVNERGDRAYADEMDVTESLRDGIIDNLLIVTNSENRLAAVKAQRNDNIYVLDKAAFTPCKVETVKGCPKEPTWQIQADRVILDEARQRVRYENARVSMFGLPLLPLPGLRHSIGDEGSSGLLVPDIGYDRRNGVQYVQPYYWRLAPNRDLTLTPYVYSAVLPMLGASYRALLSKGAYQITGYGTVSAVTPVTGETDVTSDERLRGYIAASGKFQFDPLWSLTGSLRYASDRTFLNRYDLSHEDRLRSTLNLERIGRRSYLSIAGWAFQSLRSGDRAGQVPIAIPAIDYRLRTTDPLFGGRVELQANSLSILRTDGQDTQRAFVGFTWKQSRLTGMGQEVSLTAYARGDVYNSAQNDLSPTVVYRGEEGWQTRGIAALALDVRWPFIGQAFGGTQRLTPRIQLVAAPRLANLNVPNEDARAIDLEDSNLFALNRFPGYDRFEDSTRITYGFDYRFDVPNFSFDTTVGQSYRIDDRPSLLPNGTGLSDRLSDIVGRSEIRYKDFLSFTHRFRLDKDGFAVRRNEIEATVGTRRTYAEVGYLRLDRNITSGVEDLRDVEEIRLAARVAFARFWSVFGSTNIDLTGQRDDPTSTLSGFEPVRHRLGIAYEDDCLELGFTWRRDYQTVGDARRGNSFQLRLVFKNLGL
ncbi:LPS-assembly protein [Sphingobium sp. B7D2B]|uniref:LPS-assembly protein LptD n=1 Tax=Sphingobium sp. B7D2B TaxID=2940583 RepID=UPI002224E70F|nr:LPS assembly protein LptD [Sphingobium sp. B7D2B]MCW2366612.1 LPS-assembly protein [Sphingobium sp. B7D2B]